MSRSAYDIAATGLDDLYAAQDAFICFEAMFDLMRKQFPEGSNGAAFAQLGLLQVEQWASTVRQWSECMDSELDALKEERRTYNAKIRRMCVLRAAQWARAE